MIAVRFRAAICISVYHTQQRMSMRNKKVELLAPAGNAEAFYGAVHAGADAIYLGGILKLVDSYKSSCLRVK